MPHPHDMRQDTSCPDSTLAEVLRQCLAGLCQPLPALTAWLDRLEAQP